MRGSDTIVCRSIDIAEVAVAACSTVAAVVTIVVVAAKTYFLSKAVQ